MTLTLLLCLPYALLISLAFWGEFFARSQKSPLCDAKTKRNTTAGAGNSFCRMPGRLFAKARVATWAESTAPGTKSFPLPAQKGGV